MSHLLLAAIFFPLIWGALMLLLPEKILNSDKRTERMYLIGLSVTSLLLLLAEILIPNGTSVRMLPLTAELPIVLTVDRTARLFHLLTLFIWVMAGIFSIPYMRGENALKRYYAFYIATLGILTGLDFSGNLVTLYMFFELTTLISAPLVFHNQTREAVLAGLKYMFFSFCGAYCALFGLYFLYHYTQGDLSFALGGQLSGEQSFLLLPAFLMILGFGVKAGMFPLHAWLPAAHPVAPSPASAALSGIIVKAGVLAIFRSIYYVIGADAIRGTWVQRVWIILSLITVFMGSMLAYMEPVLKKRLAYSTVSQLSYILFGMALMNTTSLTGSLSHVVFHAIIKCALFLTAGAIIHATGKTRVEDMYGLGRTAPVLMLSYTVVSLGLIGIPPMSGFVSKWYLCLGALETGDLVMAIFGIVTLLLSALLTAGYLLPLTIHAFFPGDHETISLRVSPLMTIPVAILALATLILGIYPKPLLDMIGKILEVL